MILITGASSGIGKATAYAYAKEKKSLILLARRKERLDEMAKDIETTFGVTCHTFVVDVCSKKQIQAFVDNNAELLSQVEVLVNNAGLARGFEPIQNGDTDHWDVMIDTNIKGLLYVTRAILPFMQKHGDGHVVNVGSVAGYWAYPKGNVYSATKFAVRALTESLRIDLLGTGIRVTEIAPGAVETEFSEVRFNDKTRAKAVYDGFEPLCGEDIAEAIVWCTSRPSRVNIQQLVIYPTAQASTQLTHRQ